MPMWLKFCFPSLLCMVVWSGITLATTIQGPSQPCSKFLQELNIWGMRADNSLKVYPGPEQASPYFTLYPSYHELFLEVPESKVSEVARKIALGRPLEAVVALLRNGRRHENRVALSPLLPSHVTDVLGRCTNAHCYEAAFRVRDPDFQWTYETFGRYVAAKYTDVGAGSTLSFGDVILFWAPRGPKKAINTLHSAVYIGGDMVYQRMSNDPRMRNEFVSLAGLYDYFAMQSIYSPGEFFWGNQLFAQFLRWDPTKSLPAAKSPTSPMPNFLELSAKAREALLLEAQQQFRVVAPPAVAVEHEPVSISFENVSPNASCPCQSGKKFKHCHGRAENAP